MSEPIRVLIVDDHDMMVDALQSLLGDYPELRVVGVAGDVAAAVAAVESERPDVVLMDFRLRGGDGTQAARAIRQRQPGVAVVFLSADESETARLAAAEAGASAYLVKSVAMAELADVVRRAGEGARPRQRARPLRGRRDGVV